MTEPHAQGAAAAEPGPQPMSATIPAGLVIPLDAARTPEVHGSVWLAPGSVVVGAVRIAEDASIWYHAVVRGDSDAIEIGARANLQDGVVIHTHRGGHPAVIGADVSIGHNAVVHGATIEDGALIGMSATVLNGATVGTGSLVAAGALVPQGVVIPPHSLVAGVPARVVRELRAEERDSLTENAAAYLGYTALHRAATRGAGGEMEAGARDAL